MKTLTRYLPAGLLIPAILMLLFSFMMKTATIEGFVKNEMTGQVIAGAKVTLKNNASGSIRNVVTGNDGKFKLVALPAGTYKVTVSAAGYVSKPATVVNLSEGQSLTLTFIMKPALKDQKQTSIAEKTVMEERMIDGTPLSISSGISTKGDAHNKIAYEVAMPDYNTEQYDYLPENEFHQTNHSPLSTFSIDVDGASYANIRRFIQNGSLPPIDAVRIEEMINYFHYEYAQPEDEDPFAIHTEATACPWNTSHQLVSIALQGKKLALEQLPSSNLVFLVDVSGSMMPPNKLPLLKKSLSMLISQLRDEDRVALVVYAGNAGLVLPSTPGSDKETILNALEALEAGGSTAGGAGIQLAYKVAKENFIKGGNNRVILATDGDFNVGVSSDGELVRIIEEKRESGIFLTVLGYGMGNLKDSRMEKLANKGNGNYGYIDNIMEAKKVLVSEMGGTLHTIAKDVKLQVEFNPEHVKAYKLIGYENRMLKEKDFNDDKKDAGELGSGHTVTALYEIIPAGSDEETGSIDPLKYQKPAERTTGNGEMLTVKFRYKEPDGTTSKLITRTLKNKTTRFESSSENLRIASAVAAFGLALRNSAHKGSADFEMAIRIARSAKGKDEEGYRAEFIRLTEMAQLLKNSPKAHHDVHEE